MYILLASHFKLLYFFHFLLIREKYYLFAFLNNNTAGFYFLGVTLFGANLGGLFYIDELSLIFLSDFIMRLYLNSRWQVQLAKKLPSQIYAF